MNTMKRVVILGNGAAGAENQCIGLVEALGLSNYEVHRISPSRPYRALPPSLHVALAWISPFLGYQSSDIDRLRCADGHFPDLVVASGRTTAPLSCAIKRASKGTTKTVQIQYPQLCPSYFDLVITPEHDYASNICSVPPNVLLTSGSLHRVRRSSLAQAADEWRGFLDQFPSPKVGVLIGGSTSRCSMTKESGDQLVRELRGLRSIPDAAGASGDNTATESLATRSDSGDSSSSEKSTSLGAGSGFDGSFLLSLSRRTPPTVAHLLSNKLLPYGAPMCPKNLSMSDLAWPVQEVHTTGDNTSPGRCYNLESASGRGDWNINGGVFIWTPRGQDEVKDSVVMSNSSSACPERCPPAGNPYLAILALCDVLVVSADSASMTSEAVAARSLRKRLTLQPTANQQRGGNKDETVVLRAAATSPPSVLVFDWQNTLAENRSFWSSWRERKLRYFHNLLLRSGATRLLCNDGYGCCAARAHGGWQETAESDVDGDFIARHGEGVVTLESVQHLDECDLADLCDDMRLAVIAVKRLMEKNTTPQT